MSGGAKGQNVMVEGWEMHQRKKTGFQGKEEKAVCTEGREKSRVKGQEGKTRIWGPSQSSFPDLLSG